MRDTHSALSDERCATQATVGSDIARFAPLHIRPIPEAVIRLLTALARHDGRTYTHSLRVSRLAWQLSLLLDGDQEQAQLAFFAGLLHDIGKIDLPRSILHKPAPLDVAEWVLVMLYPARGSRLLGGQGDLAALSPIVMAHQERPDGLGYPRGLRQPDIPCMALRIAVADATDAMGSHRPYAAPMTVEEIGEELRAGAGACWDYASAMLAAQELSQNGRFLASPWLMSPPLRAPALSLSEGHHTSAPSIETTS